jgi:hypothetical protein
MKWALQLHHLRGVTQPRSATTQRNPAQTAAISDAGGEGSLSMQAHTWLLSGSTSLCRIDLAVSFAYNSHLELPSRPTAKTIGFFLPAV